MKKKLKSKWLYRSIWGATLVAIGVGIPFGFGSITNLLVSIGLASICIYNKEHPLLTEEEKKWLDKISIEEKNSTISNNTKQTNKKEKKIEKESSIAQSESNYKKQIKELKSLKKELDNLKNEEKNKVEKTFKKTK